MTVDSADIATPDYGEIDADERLGKVRSIFEHDRPKGIVVTEDGAYTGIVNQKQLIQSHIQDGAKVRGLVTEPSGCGKKSANGALRMPYSSSALLAKIASSVLSPSLKLARRSSRLCCLRSGPRPKPSGSTRFARRLRS
jgi:hypothetical protein